MPGSVFWACQSWSAGRLVWRWVVPTSPGRREDMSQQRPPPSGTWSCVLGSVGQWVALTEEEEVPRGAGRSRTRQGSAAGGWWPGAGTHSRGTWPGRPRRMSGRRHRERGQRRSRSPLGPCRRTCRTKTRNVGLQLKQACSLLVKFSLSGWGSMSALDQSGDGASWV